eukprot:m.164586 g.164586  ORF g.164586 m.164586 type:complete len:380 (-) comp17140_c0_seq2:260-1399(-)
MFWPVTLETWKIGQMRSDTKLVAQTTASSSVLTTMGTLRQPGLFRILWSTCMVSARTSGGHMSIFVTTTYTGTFSASASRRCSLVMPTMPMFAPTISMAKCGAWPVKPKTVVFRYFSWPARSMKVSTLDELWQISCQLREPLWFGLLVTLPRLSKPRMSCAMLDVRPVSSSCLWRKIIWRERPRPLSSSPCVSTPSSVLLPESTLPQTAMRSSRKSSSWKRVRIKYAAVLCLMSLPDWTRAMSALISAAALPSVSTDCCSSSSLRFSLSWTPISKMNSPQPSFMRARRSSTSSANCSAVGATRFSVGAAAALSSSSASTAREMSSKCTPAAMTERFVDVRRVIVMSCTIRISANDDDDDDDGDDEVGCVRTCMLVVWQV